jgi:hypothetical protein
MGRGVRQFNGAAMALEAFDDDDDDDAWDEMSANSISYHGIRRIR